MDRFELERAMVASTMPTLSKTLFLVLCTRVDARTGAILPQHQPSLTQLARMASVCRSSVRNHLGRLEAEGWVTSTPPPPDAQRMGARTCYDLHVPGSPEHRSARAAQPPSMRRPARRARAALAMEQAKARKPPARGVKTAPAPRAGTVPAARPSPPAWRAAGADPLGDEAMARAKARDAARRQT